VSTIDRHLRRVLFAHFGIALATLLSIFSVVSLAEELEAVGRGDYGVGQALRFVLLTLPYEAYELFPACALLGGVTGLGALAAHQEIVALSASGVSPSRVLFLLVRNAAWLALGAVLLAEAIAPPLSQTAYAERSVAMSGGAAMVGRGGLWVHEPRRFVNVRSPSYDGTLRDLSAYEFDDGRRLVRVIDAASATFEDGRWRLSDVVVRPIAPAESGPERHAELALEAFPRPTDVRRLLFPAEALGSLDVLGSIASLRARGESASRYELAIWKRFVTPIAMLVMVFLAAPIVLGAPARGGVGARVVVGALAGVAYPLVTQTLTQAGLVYGIPAAVTTLLPAALALAVAAAMLRRTLE
jgi:lipopolysaccharide export system permease protein